MHDANTRLHTLLQQPRTLAVAYWSGFGLSVSRYRQIRRPERLLGHDGLPVFIATLVALAEVGGSLFLLAGGWLKNGLLTHLGAAAFIPVLLGAIAMVHWPRWSFVASETHPMGGMEFQVVLMLITVYLLLRGNSA